MKEIKYCDLCSQNVVVDSNKTGDKWCSKCGGDALMEQIKEQPTQASREIAEILAPFSPEMRKSIVEEFMKTQSEVSK